MTANETDIPISAPRARRSYRAIEALALIVVLQLPIGKYLAKADGVSGFAERELIFWALAALLIAYVRFMEVRPLASIGWRRPSWKTLTFGVTGATIMIAGIALIYLVLFPVMGLPNTENTLSTIQTLPTWLRVAMVIRAAFFEELFFRGFMIERLAAISGNRSLAAGLSLTAFTFAHLASWGWPHLIVAGFGGVVLTGLYWLRRDLATNMLAHFLTDAIGFLT
jgi:membrane protease YdiL (CAAX protease family)